MPDRRLALIDMRRTALWVGLVSGVLATATWAEPPATLLIDGRMLARSRDRVRAGDPALQGAYSNLLHEAEAALVEGPFTVMNKTMTPPSGDKHDYMSFGRYWWPDPDQPDGLPYMRRDGETNPDSQGPASDRPRLGRMTDHVETLALAYYFTGEAKYAEHAALLISTWFLDPATKMNPHVKYAQGIPGRRTGGKSGLIDARLFSKVVDAVGLLSASKALGPAEQNGLRDWFRAYLKWLQTGENPREESSSKNNHGTWFDVQFANIALFAGEADLARAVLEAAVEKRILAQIQRDGSQPHELARTRPNFYSLFNLEAMFALARLGEHVGLDLWHAPEPNAARVRSALDYVAAYADESIPWPHPTVSPPDRADLLPLLLQGSAVYGDEAYRKAIAALPADEVAAPRELLLYPCPVGHGR